MKILSKKNVFDAALERINYLFDEFPNIVVGMSGGKDSTVVFELTLRVARERGRLPLTVFFLDQEAEWTTTIEYVRKVMHLSAVKPLWLQMPMLLENATSYETRFLKCWDPAEEANWIFPKDPVSIKENRYGTERFTELFAPIFRIEYPQQKVAVIAGVRCEESPTRLMAMTSDPTYKWITWGRKLSPDQFTFYPLYDWSYTDIWHAIQSEGWEYNRHYNYMYRYGVPVPAMRVSNLHHETAVRSLFHLQEIDPPLYERLVKRLPGVDTAGKMGSENYYARKLPFMFQDWCDYRDFLIEKLVAPNADWYKKIKKVVKQWDVLLAAVPTDKERAAAAVVQSVLCNDYCLTKVKNFKAQFIGKYKHDKAAALAFTDDRMFRSDDPLTFKWFENHILGKWGALEAATGRRCYFPTQPGLNQHKYWIEGGDILCRALLQTTIVKSRSSSQYIGNVGEASEAGEETSEKEIPNRRRSLPVSVRVPAPQGSRALANAN